MKYLVAGGLAVNAHGYLRFTKDVDFVVQLVPDNIGGPSAILTLICMTEAANRPQDRIDIEHLRMSLEDDVED